MSEEVFKGLGEDWERAVRFSADVTHDIEVLKFRLSCAFEIAAKADQNVAKIEKVMKGLGVERPVIKLPSSSMDCLVLPESRYCWTKRAKD